MKQLYRKLSVLTLMASAVASHDLWAFAQLDQRTLTPSQGSLAIQFTGAGNYKIVGAGTSKVARAKIGQDLTALGEEYQTFSQSSGQGLKAQAFKSRNTMAPIAGDSVVIDAASDDPQALAAQLRGLGAQKVTFFGRLVSARLPLSSIPDLNNLASLRFARPAYAALNTGSVTSQGDKAMRADIARTSFGVDGADVMVGTLSDSYDCLGGAAAGVVSGDLPAGVSVLEEAPICTGDLGGIDEGRAMMEIIHDVAPGASLAFHTAFNGQADFAQGIIDLANAGAKVINDDVVYFAEPFYQDGLVAQAVDTVKGMGAAYFSAAGNQGRNAYESAFRPSGVFFDLSSLGKGIAEAHDFNPGPGVDFCQKITIPTNRTLILDFQWDQPFFSVSGAPGSASDLDIVVTDASCTSALVAGLDVNTGDDPIEITGGQNVGSITTFGVILLHNAGPKPGLMKMINMGSSSVTFDQFKTNSATNFGHSAARGGLGVGAADYLDTPAFGVARPVIESFSSAGGSPILFDTAGNRLATSEIRQQPAITAPDGGDTTFFPPFPGSDSDSSGFPNFFGTSAAAPHAAGVAALLKDLVPTLSADNLYTALKVTALDMNDPKTRGFDKSFDFGTGFGLVQADAALTHDLAVVKIAAPSTVKGSASVTKTVSVSIQNRSPHNETISVPDLGDGISTGLVRLNVNVVDDDVEGCAAASVVLDSAHTLKGSKVLKPKKTLAVKYFVTYDCAGAQPKSAGDATAGDYSYEASVHHDALYGMPDSHPVDDLCPRSVTPPFELDPYPNSTIKDKGCGAKKADKTFGNPVVTNIIR